MGLFGAEGFCLGSRVYGKIWKGFSREYPCKPFVVNLPATAEQSDARADDDVTKKETSVDRSVVRHGLKNGHGSLQIGLFHIRKAHFVALWLGCLLICVCVGDLSSKLAGLKSGSNLQRDHDPGILALAKRETDIAPT